MFCCSAIANGLFSILLLGFRINLDQSVTYLASMAVFLPPILVILSATPETISPFIIAVYFLLLNGVSPYRLLYAFHIDAPFSLLYHDLIQTGQSVC